LIKYSRIFKFLVLLFLANQILANVLTTLNRGDGQVDTLDPHKAEGVPAINVLDDLYEGLMTHNQDGKLVLGTAEKYEVSHDGLRYMFYIRDNAKWSNGKKLTAHDFEYGLKRAVDPKTAGTRATTLDPIKNAEKILKGEVKPQELGVKALNDKMLQINLEYPTPLIFEILSNTVSFPVYKPSAEKYGDRFTQPGNHVTNGAFKLKEWVINSHLTLEKNYNYWDANDVKLKVVKYFDIEQPMQEFRRYQSGQVDLTSNVPTENINYIKRSLKDELITGPYMAVYYYGFNVNDPLLRDKNLRKALSFAVDRKIITDKLLRMGETPRQHIVPKRTENYENPVIEEFELSDELRIKAAQKAFADAGYSKKNAPTITILYNTMDSHKQIAVLVSAMWKSILGVKTELINAEWKVFLKDVKEKRNTQVFRQGIVGDFNDAYSILEVFHSESPSNSIGYNHVKYDEYINKAKVENDSDKRMNYLQKSEAQLLNDHAVMPLYTYTVKKLVKPYVGGFNANFMNKNLSKYLYIKYDKDAVKDSRKV